MNLTKRQIWEKHVTDYRSSGKSARAWCEAKQVKIHTLRYWISKFNSETKTNPQCKNATPTQWVQIEACKPEQTIAGTALEITIGQATIKVASGFDSELLKEVVKVLSLC